MYLFIPFPGCQRQSGFLKTHSSRLDFFIIAGLTIEDPRFTRQVSGTLPPLSVGCRSAAIDEMESYLNLSRGAHVDLKRDLCSSRLSMNGRGTAMVSTGHQVQFCADQVRELGRRAGTRTFGSRREIQQNVSRVFVQAIGVRLDCF